MVRMPPFLSRAPSPFRENHKKNNCKGVEVLTSLISLYETIEAHLNDKNIKFMIKCLQKIPFTKVKALENFQKAVVRWANKSRILILKNSQKPGGNKEEMENILKGLLKNTLLSPLFLALL